MDRDLMVRQRSKLLFNNAHLLRIAAEIEAAPEVFSAKHLQETLVLGQSTVQRTLRVLEGAGLVLRKARTAQTVPMEYSRAPHAFWSAVREFSAFEEAA